MILHSLRLVIMLVLLSLFTGVSCSAETVANEIAAGFAYRVNLLTYLLRQEPADNPQNPGNTVFQIPQNNAVIELRPDLNLVYKNIDLSVKVRARYQWEEIKINGSSSSKEKGDLFVNEWLARFMASDRLFFSYGRENLQWGPGWLSSPSNPFFYYNGRLNPELEVPGKDFARIVYLPNMAWTISIISNLGKGRTKLFPAEKFNKTHALKVDYTVEAVYGGIILSHKEQGGSNAGAFGGWTVSNAMLLYADLNFSADNNKVDQQQTALLTGVSYTLESGPTLSLEYAYQKDDPDFSNHNSVMIQYQQNEIMNSIDLLLRATANIEDGSMQFVVNADYIAGNHVQLFFNTIINSGSEGREFVHFLDYQLMAGLEYSF